MEDKLILKTIADNPALFEAVKRIVEAEFALEDIDTRTMANGLIGEVVRARLEGLKKVNEAFRKIYLCRTTVDNRKTVNPAR